MYNEFKREGHARANPGEGDEKVSEFLVDTSSSRVGHLGQILDVEFSVCVDINSFRVSRMLRLARFSTPNVVPP